MPDFDHDEPMTSTPQYEPDSPDMNARMATYYNAPFSKGPVFPGKPYQMPEDLPTYYAPGNLAVKRYLGEIFDEFTVMISGELKSMDMNEYRQARFDKTGTPPVDSAEYYQAASDAPYYEPGDDFSAPDYQP